MRGDVAGGIAQLDAWVQEVGSEVPSRDAITAYAACGARAQAVQLMARKVDRGNEHYGDFLVESVLYGSDFTLLRDDPDFEAIVSRLHPYT